LLVYTGFIPVLQGVRNDAGLIINRPGSMEWPDLISKEICTVSKLHG